MRSVVLLEISSCFGRIVALEVGGLKNGPQRGWLELASTTLCDPGLNFDNSLEALETP